MPRYNVKYKDKWACYSSISDEFLTAFMDKSEYENWRKLEYKDKYDILENCNQMSIKQAISSSRLYNSHDETIKNVIASGISKEESEQMLYDIETEEYVPILKGDGTFECPNCHSKVLLGQKFCTEDDCNLEFVWRI